jgi:hypothetical protein
MAEGGRLAAVPSSINSMIDGRWRLGEAGGPMASRIFTVHTSRPRCLLLGPLLILAGCVAPTKPAPAPPAPAPPTYSVIGLESVMGKSAQLLETQFGRPDLDVREGDARKLQYSSSVCVLDAYLYPPGRGGEPVVTHVDARLPDGRDVDRASCVAALARREEAR